MYVTVGVSVCPTANADWFAPTSTLRAAGFQPSWTTSKSHALNWPKAGLRTSLFQRGS